MGKLACDCGNIISDTTETESEENWGIIFKNKEWFDYHEDLSKILSELMVAYKNDDHIKWLKENCPVYSDQAIDSIINDILTRLSYDIGKCYAKCDKCNGYMIQNKINENQYTYYKNI